MCGSNLRLGETGELYWLKAPRVLTSARDRGCNKLRVLSLTLCGESRFRIWASGDRDRGGLDDGGGLRGAGSRKGFGAVTGSAGLRVRGDKGLGDRFAERLEERGGLVVRLLLARVRGDLVAGDLVPAGELVPAGDLVLTSVCGCPRCRAACLGDL